MFDNNKKRKKYLEIYPGFWRKFSTNCNSHRSIIKLPRTSSKSSGSTTFGKAGGAPKRLPLNNSFRRNVFFVDQCDRHVKSYEIIVTQINFLNALLILFF
jgi:hypothetical protein